MPSSAPPPGGRRAFFIAGRDAAAARSLAGRMGSSTADLNFPLLFSPTLISVTPNSGSPAGGTIVDLAGMNFRAGATVTFGGASATGVIFVSPLHITCTTPAHASGSVNVTVTNPDAQTTTLVGGYTYQFMNFVAVSSNGNSAAVSLDGISWAARSMPAGDYRCVAFSPTLGLFVASGAAGVLATSPDGEVWTAQTPIPVNDANVTIFAVKWDAAHGVFIAVGGARVNALGGIVSTSPDGVTWTARNISGNVNFILFGIGIGSTTSIAVGEVFNATHGAGLKIVAGTDPTTPWASTSLTVDTPVFGRWRRTDWNGSVFAAAPGTTATAVTSSNGSAYTSRAMPASSYGVMLWDSFRGLFVAAGSGIAATSPTGVTWTARTAPAGLYRDCAAISSVTVLVGDGGACASSTDDITWVARTMPSALVNYRGACARL
jgi:hypothetical protein